MLPLADVTNASAQIIGPIIGVLAGGLLTALIHRWRQRRKGAVDVKAAIRRHNETLYGRQPSFFEKHPPPGLVDQVEAIAAVQTEHTGMLSQLLTKTTPNGENTRELGDIVLLIAQRLGIDIPEHGEGY